LRVNVWCGVFYQSVIAAWQIAFGFVPLLIVVYWREGSPLKFHWTSLAVISLFYLALVGSCAAFLLFYWLVRHMDVTKTMLISLVTPIIAISLGMVWLHERLAWRSVIGGAGIMAGIALNVYRRARASTQEGIAGHG